MQQQRSNIPATRALEDFGIWHLRRIDLLKSVEPAALSQFARLLQLREFKRGETIYVISGSRDEHLARMYFLLKGRVKLSSVDDASGNQLLLLLIKPGEPFGLLTAVGNEGTDLQAIAMQASLVAYVQRADFDKLIERAGAGSRLVKHIGEKSVEVVARFEDLAFRSVLERLARVLIHLARDFSAPRVCGTCIDVPLTQQEVASLIGARREVVSTHLSRLKREGVIAFHKDCICIHDPGALGKLAG